MIIAVVDDTMQDRELLKGMLDQYFSGHQTVPEIQEFESGEAFLEAYEPGHYDIIFFDIYMGGITGMETALWYMSEIRTAVWCSLAPARITRWTATG